jgi:hypothetical protein
MFLAKNAIWGLKYFLESLKNEASSHKGNFAITFDVETANEFIHHINDVQMANLLALKSRISLENLRIVLEKIGIPVTLLCTGHALLKECNKHNLGPFPWATPQKGFNDFWTKHNWFHFDPGTSYRKDPAWYFGDIIENFLSSSVEHEIASHTFSHLRCDLASKQVFLEDMLLLQKTLSEIGLELVSHAYPFDIPGHLDCLQDIGIKVVRIKRGIFPSSINGCMVLPHYTFVFESLFGFLYPSLIRLGINIAIRKKGIFLWLLHPYDLYEKINTFVKILNYAKNAESSGKLVILTLKEFAKT